MIYTADTRFDDIQDKSVLDLGSGCGMLSIASIFLGSTYNTAIEIDPDAIGTCKANMDRCLPDDHLEIVQADVTSRSFAREACTFDTVILNPPFGTKNNQGIDMVFLQTALKVHCNRDPFYLIPSCRCPIMPSTRCTRLPLVRYYLQLFPSSPFYNSISKGGLANHGMWVLR